MCLEAVTYTCRTTNKSYAEENPTTEADVYFRFTVCFRGGIIELKRISYYTNSADNTQEALREVACLRLLRLLALHLRGCIDCITPACVHITLTCICVNSTELLHVTMCALCKLVESKCRMTLDNIFVSYTK